MKKFTKTNLMAGLVVGALSMASFMTSANAITTVNEVETNDSISTAQLTGPHDGSIDVFGRREQGSLSIFDHEVTNDIFAFEGTVGDTISLEVFDEGAITVFDSVLRIFSPMQAELDFNDDGGSDPSTRGSRIDIVLPGSGLFYAAVGGSSGDDIFDYRLEIRGLTPTAAVSAVPVPAALPLFGTGLAVMGFVGWRRKRKQA